MDGLGEAVLNVSAMLALPTNKQKLKTNFTFPIEKQSKASSCQSKDKQESGKTCSKKNFKLREVSDQIKYKIRVLEGMLTFLFSLLFCTRGTGPGAWA